MDENDLKKLLKNKKFKTYEQHKREKKLKTIGMELGVPFAMGVGMYAIGKGIYNGINKVAKTAFPDLKDYKDYTTLQQDSRYRGTPGMYGTGLRHMGVNWLGKKYAINYYPSIYSFYNLNQIKFEQAKNDFLGFGDPYLKAENKTNEID